MSDPLDDLALIQSEQADVPTGEAKAKMAKLASAEAQSYEPNASDDDGIFEKKLRIGFHFRELKQIDEMLDTRKDFANKIYRLVVWWLTGIASIVSLSGLGGAFHFFSLSDKVLMALIGGTTVNVIGIFAIVAKFIFPNKGHELPRWSKDKKKPRGSPPAVPIAKKRAVSRSTKAKPSAPEDV